MDEIQLESERMLAAKLSDMSQKIGLMTKDGTNSFSNYTYTSNEQLVRAVRDHSNECKVKIIPSVLSFNERDFQNEKGKTVTRTTVSMSFKVIDLETGYSATYQFTGAEQDTGGKSMQQAITQCTKYFYFKLLDVASKEEVDGDGKTTEAPPPDTRPWLDKGTPQWSDAIKYLKGDGTIAKIKEKYRINKKDEETLMEAAMA